MFLLLLYNFCYIFMSHVLNKPQPDLHVQSAVVNNIKLKKFN